MAGGGGGRVGRASWWAWIRSTTIAVKPARAMKAAMMDEAATVNFPGTRVVSDTENDHMNSKYSTRETRLSL
jgi:hypothetical protein